MEHKEQFIRTPEGDCLKNFILNSKEVAHLFYDYFRNIIIVSSSVILIAFAFFDRIGGKLLFWQKIILFFALSMFFVMIPLSLRAMRKATNLLIHSNAMLDAIEKGNPQEADEPFAGYKVEIFSINTIERFIRYGFLLGIAIILFLSGFMFFA